MPDNDDRKQEVAVCVILSVTAIEAFVNVYFRVVVSEAEFADKAEPVLSGIKSLMSTKDKLEKWSQLLFAKHFDFATGPGKAFVDLNKRRNKLVHFKSGHLTVSLPGVAIHGLADITAYTSLTPQDAHAAVHTAESVLSHVFKLRTGSDADVPHFLHAWTGQVP